MEMFFSLIIPFVLIHYGFSSIVLKIISAIKSIVKYWCDKLSRHRAAVGPADRNPRRSDAIQRSQPARAAETFHYRSATGTRRRQRQIGARRATKNPAGHALPKNRSMSPTPTP
jgi:hypothetical protein